MIFMFSKQIDDNIKTLDIDIGILTYELRNAKEVGDEEEYEQIVRKIDKLVDLRKKLTDCKEQESKKVLSPIVLSGITQALSILMILRYEEENVITSKSFNMASKIFK